MRTILDILERSYRQFPLQPALKIKPRYRSVVWSYSQFYNFATGIAKILEEKGLDKQERVLIWAKNSPYWLGAFFGCLLKGIIVVPIHTPSQPQFIKKVASQTEAKLILKSKEFKKPPAVNLDAFNIDYRDQLIEAKHSFQKPSINQKDTAEILYTSGTTGSPKGVMLTHKNIISDLKAIENIIKIEPSDKFLSILPLSHIFEQIVDLRTLQAGAQIVFAPALASPIILRTLREERITKMVTVPEFLKLAMQGIESQAQAQHKGKILQLLFTISPYLPKGFRKILFHSIHRKFGGKLDLIVSGGAPLEESIGKKWQLLGINILQGYGLTETSPVVSVTPPPFKNLTSVGKPVPECEVKIAADGEILVKGPMVFSGYWKDAKKTKQAFKQGWFKTGDIGSQDKQGFLYIKGRKKFMILTGSGQNVFPEDIEFELNKEPSVEDSCVVGLTKKGTKQIHAVLLGDIKNAQEVIDRANKRLASFQRIQSWSVWPFSDFPRTITKKVKHHKVRQYLTKEAVPPEMKRAQKQPSPLVKILASITNTEPNLISPKTQIVKDLGLDSLMRIELVAQIEEEFGVEIDEAKITPTTRVKDIQKWLQAKPKRKVKYQISWWQLNPLTKIVRKILQQWFLFSLLGLYAQVKAEGTSNLKEVRERPVVFMANHISILDAPCVLKALPSRFRNKCGLAAATDILYEKFAWLRPLITLLFNTYPFPRRGQIKSGLKHTGSLLDENWSLLFFPEGRESPTGKLLPFKKGAGVIGATMQVPVIPVKVKGTNRVFPYGSRFPKKRGPVVVKFGPPLLFKKGIKPWLATKTIEEAIRDL